MRTFCLRPISINENEKTHTSLHRHWVHFHKNGKCVYNHMFIPTNFSGLISSASDSMKGVYLYDSKSA